MHESEGKEKKIATSFRMTLHIRHIALEYMHFDTIVCFVVRNAQRSCCLMSVYIIFFVRVAVELFQLSLQIAGKAAKWLHDTSPFTKL